METVVEFVLWLAQIAFWYMLFTVLFNIIQIKRLSREKDELMQVVHDLETQQLIPLTVEVDRNIYLCYNSLTNDFVCQGQNIQEILSRFKQRFPGRHCALSKGDPEVLKELKKQLKELDESSSSIGSTS